MTAEFANAANDYAIVFAGGDAIMPSIILGARDRENVFVGNDGQWNAAYVPAFVRRYPFIFSGADGNETLTLCVDESFEGVNREGRGERLFDADGEQTQYLKNVLGFLQAYQAQFQVTKAFCNQLQEMNLMEPMQAQFRLEGDQSVALSGFLAVSRDKVKALSGDQLAALAANGGLELIYRHLFSIRNLEKVAEKMRVSGANGASATA
jgi:hypothetical protein